MSDFDPALSKKGSSQNPSGFSTKEDEHSSSFEGINEVIHSSLRFGEIKGKRKSRLRKREIPYKIKMKLQT